MGLQFGLRHVNFIAYLTASQVKTPPRFTDVQVRDFLQALLDSPDWIVSSNDEWPQKLRDAASSALEHPILKYVPLLEEKWLSGGKARLLASKTTANLLGPLTTAFRAFPAYGLLVSERSEDNFGDFREFGRLTGDRMLVLRPDVSLPAEGVSLLEPLPFLDLLAARLDQWPGMLVWTPDGQSAFVSLEEARDAFAFPFPRWPWFIDERLIRLRADFPRSRSILHLSDLHHGTTRAAQVTGLLTAEISRVVESVDQIAITGDLFDSPRKWNVQLYDTFRQMLRLLSAQDPIVIPGNHDWKLGGFGISRPRQVQGIQWGRLVIDDDAKMVFHCFDSARDARLGRGFVNQAQLIEMATEFDTLRARRPELDHYLKIALVHHHPFDYRKLGCEPKTRIPKPIAWAHNFTVCMREADKFVEWCGRRHIGLILHGHKHIQRYVSRTITLDDSNAVEQREVVAVGCGTSLGDKGAPLSYNLVDWSPGSQRWAVRFYADKGDGSGFRQQRVSFHKA